MGVSFRNPLRRLAVTGQVWQFPKMNRIWRHLSSSVTAFALLSFSTPLSAQAAEDGVLQVRGGDHEGYTRLVFEGKEPPHYTTSKTDTSLVLKFSKPARMNIQGAAPETLSRINAYKAIDNQSVELDFSKGITVRHFVIGNRVIVDLKGKAPNKTEEKRETQKKSEGSQPEDLTKAVAAEPAKAEAEDKASKDVEEITEKIGDKTGHVKVDEYREGSKPVETAASPLEQSAQQQQQPQLDPYQITMAGTTSFAMAAFEKGGNLWLVIDKPDVVIPPQIEGPDPSKLGDFTRMESKDLSIFKLPIPEGYKLHGDGGGLLWKIVLDDKPDSKYPPKPLEQKFEDKSDKGQAAVGAVAPKTKTGPTLTFDAVSFRRTQDIEDPESGEKIHLVLVEDAHDYTGDAQRFSELETLPSIIGLALVAKVDDLTIAKGEAGADISRPSGLALSQEKDILMYKKAPAVEEVTTQGEGEMAKIFDFKNWRAGGPSNITDNQSLILSSLLEQNDQKKTENLITLGRMMISNGFAPEAFGFFDLAEQYTPDVGKNAEFVALRGASESLSGNYKEGFLSLSMPALETVGEVGYWKAYALAGLDDWQQAAKVMPNQFDLLKSYPDEALWPLALKLAEVALREGNTKKAEEILNIIEATKTAQMPLAYSAALTYLKGELLRQKRDVDKGKELWSELETGKDDLYRAKARLALTTLRYGQKEITLDKAIDNLEGLRYAWRGDELEATINFNLGKFYLEKGMPVRALGLMRQAAGLIPNSEQGKMISQVMHTTFQDLYLTDKIQTLSPVEALTLYDEFSELVPKGAEGDRLARQLAERLVAVDLLPRAINLLKNQVETRLSGLEGSSVAIRLASLQIQDNKPKSAMESLDKAEEFLGGQKAEDADPKRRQIAMLRAKAHSLMGKPQDSFKSLSLLPQDEDVLRLRADIAWKSKKWQDSADAIEQLISKQDISLTRPLTDEQSRLVLNWALSLYLADNRYVLANLRERYGDLMSQSRLAKEFEVVTRPRQNVLLADRDTIQSVIGETDIFKNFLDSFKEDLKGPLPKESAVPTATSSGKTRTAPPNIPEPLKNTPPEIRTDEVLAD